MTNAKCSIFNVPNRVVPGLQTDVFPGCNPLHRQYLLHFWAVRSTSSAYSIKPCWNFYIHDLGEQFHTKLQSVDAWISRLSCPAPSTIVNTKLLWFNMFVAMLVTTNSRPLVFESLERNCWVSTANDQKEVLTTTTECLSNFFATNQQILRRVKMNV